MGSPQVQGLTGPKAWVRVVPGCNKASHLSRQVSHQVKNELGIF